MELSEENKADIDALLDALDDFRESEVNLAYLSGLADCLLILDSMKLFQLQGVTYGYQRINHFDNQ